MDFEFKEIERKWRKQWEDNQIYKVTEDSSRPKYYVLDMFPYPSGAGLHVGHPLGYVASDIYARYKRLKGFNVLHPMGFDAFGLPAEQYAIETGTPPQVTTDKAIATYKEQLGKIGFSYDWSREVRTDDPSYYKWTQWIFLQLFDSWYDRAARKAAAIETLIAHFVQNGTQAFAQFDPEDHAPFTAAEWAAFSDEEKQQILMHYRLAYQSYSEVNWCEALGTVLANDEVKDGKSERGGYPVERRKMRQWFLRITEYSDRLLEGLDRLDWSEAMKDMQRNWIGRSEGALVNFHLSQTLSEGEGLNTNAGKPRFHTTDILSWQANIDKARDHRSDPTEAEGLVWQRLRANGIGYKIRRQHLIGGYIPDFVCLKKALIIEIDGGIHNDQKEADELRTKELNELGFDVVRFRNEEVISNIDNVIASIKQTLDNRPDRSSIDDDKQPSQMGASVLASSPSERAGGEVLTVFTTRPDTIFGATFMVIAPEHELVASLTTPAQQKEIEDYVAYVKSRTDIERQQEKRVTGAFTGSYATNPFTGKPIPVYLAEYVLAGYGTGAIMAVPADDERDRKFADKFGLEVIEVIDKSMYPGATIEDKIGKMINSDFLNGLECKDAIKAVLDKIESLGIGSRKVNYRQRDAGYSRQRYWGEPFPIVYKGDLPYPLPVSELPVVLPNVTSYKPSGDGRSPLANATDWVTTSYGTRETDTMPGYAGSSWYFLRYMDPQNPDAFASKERLDYWQDVDLYLGGSEHAVGHLLYSRMWHKFLFDRGFVPTDEPFKKLVNQGMIQGVSMLAKVQVNKDDIDGEIKLRYDLVPPETQIIRESFKTIDGMTTNYVNNIAEYHLAIDFVIFENGKYYITREGLELTKAKYPKFSGWGMLDEDERIELTPQVEKMSKSKYNVVNPDDVIDKYGADCFRMFEMFLGPLDQSKPWDDKGIDGVGKFLRRFWRLFYDDKGTYRVTADAPTDAECKALHKALKKISEDIERLQFNTCVSQFMICVNELNDLKCTKRAILEPLLIALAPFAPFIAEELWASLGNAGSIHHASFPAVEAKYLVESAFTYPISINGKVRANLPFALDLAEADLKASVLADETVQKWLEGKEPKKFIFVKGRIVNVVV